MKPIWLKKKSCFLLVVAFLWASIMSFAADSHGTLVSDDGPDIYDWELALLLDIFIGDNYHSRVLAFTECYGGDMMGAFSGAPNTTVLSGSTPGNTTDYGGYHRGLAQGLRPGSDTDSAHASGVGHQSSGDSPTTAGPNQDIGTGGDGGAIMSTHVLVWAGQPNDLDQNDIDDIHNNFDGQPNTTVTVLSGDGTGSGVDGPANFDNLVDALDQIGSMMSKDEQFILVVTDHGDLDTEVSNVFCPPGGDCNYILDLPTSLYRDMLYDPNNRPNLALFTQGNRPIAPGELFVSFNGLGPYDVGRDFVQTALDFNRDSRPDRFEYQIFLNESFIQPGANRVRLQSRSETFLSHLSLDSGGISRRQR